MEIVRINSYSDLRFSPKVLAQHGAFVVDGAPYEVEITAADTAVIRGADTAPFPALIEEFRFYAGHITVFLDANGKQLAKFPPVHRFPLALEDIQPSQFYVDKDKLAAVAEFLTKPEDVVIPVACIRGRWTSLDGHTRLFYAVKQRWDHVCAFTEEPGDYIEDFADTAAARGVTSPKKLILLSHAEYALRWGRYCKDFFAQRG